MDSLGLGGAWLTVNRFCNFRCRWCYAASTQFRKEDDMPLDVALAWIDLLAEIGVNTVLYIGGEPTFWKYLFTVAEYAHSKGMFNVLITNGFLFSTDVFMAKMRTGAIDAINISLKAGDVTQHGELTLTKDSVFGRVLTGISNAATLGIPMEVSMIANELVLHDMAGMAEAAIAAGASREAIDFVRSHLTSRDNQ